MDRLFTLLNRKNRSALLDGYLHASLQEKHEDIRRGRLHVRFGVLGGFMTVVYSILFLVLNHLWGAMIVGLCGFVMVQVPWIVRKTGNLALTGHLYGGILLLGVSTFCMIDGGLDSMMFAWFAAIPVTAILLLEHRGAIWWFAMSVAATVLFVHFGSLNPDFLSPPISDTFSSLKSLSFFGLILYLAFLALLIEKSRLEAIDRFRYTHSELELANRELINLNRHKNEFLNIAAHDLKNPLSAICYYADLLRQADEPDKEEVHEQAKEIQKSGNHMLGIVRNLLDVQALEDGQCFLDQTRCDLYQISEEVVNHYRIACEHKHIELINRIAPNSPCAWADEQATYQVLDNLVSNAIKYSPAHRSIEIDLSTNRDEVSIVVTDQGPGLSQEDQDKLWSKFTRLTPRPTANEHSTGLGLWIVRRLALQMNGNAFCVSTPGEGSSFGVSLPLWTDSSECIERKRASASEEAGRAAFERLLEEVESSSEDNVALPS